MTRLSPTARRLLLLVFAVFWVLGLATGCKRDSDLRDDEKLKVVVNKDRKLAKREVELAQQRQREAEEAARVKAEEELRKQQERDARAAERREGIGEALAKSVARALGSNLGRQIVRGILGSITGRR